MTVDLGSGPLALITDRRYNNGTYIDVLDFLGDSVVNNLPSVQETQV